ncbi:hypothetical protein D9Q98_004253 [Chlorella vulgaris]|uniref:CDC48 N-terminal subdomain domain-containing protein n=1 Tax=Chlorella vulgaris TaxID=3077 RepID=A0A9D4TRI1_CHLVU|nr:hypothetical protein D9Q98_004253 [Chlorella vulgaris]
MRTASGRWRCADQGDPDRLLVEEVQSLDNNSVALMNHQTMSQVGCKSGDTILLKGGGKETVAIALQDESVSRGRIQMNAVLRRNAAVDAGDALQIQSLPNCPWGRRVTVRPSRAPAADQAGLKAWYQQYFADALRPVHKGDIFSKPAAPGMPAIDFIVTDVDPPDYCIVAPDTRVALAQLSGEQGVTKNQDVRGRQQREAAKQQQREAAAQRQQREAAAQRQQREAAAQRQQREAVERQQREAAERQQREVAAQRQQREAVERQQRETAQLMSDAEMAARLQVEFDAEVANHYTAAAEQEQREAAERSRREAAEQEQREAAERWERQVAQMASDAEMAARLQAGLDAEAEAEASVSRQQGDSEHPDCILTPQPQMPQMPPQQSPGFGSDVLCCYCLDRPATAGVLHMDSVHKILCRDCAVVLKEQRLADCPVCLKKIECFVMRVF